MEWERTDGRRNSEEFELTCDVSSERVELKPRSDGWSQKQVVLKQGHDGRGQYSVNLRQKGD